MKLGQIRSNKFELKIPHLYQWSFRYAIWIRKKFHYKFQYVAQTLTGTPGEQYKNPNEVPWDIVVKPPEKKIGGDFIRRKSFFRFLLSIIFGRQDGVKIGIKPVEKKYI